MAQIMVRVELYTKELEISVGKVVCLLYVATPVITDLLDLTFYIQNYTTSLLIV